QQHLHRRLAPDRMGQRQHRRRAKEADIDARRREPSILGGDREIIARDQLAAGCGRHPVDFGDDRLGHSDDRQHQLAALGEEPLVGLAPLIGTHLAQIVPGAKGGPGAGDNDDPRLWILGRTGKGFEQCRRQRDRQRIVRSRPIEAEAARLPIRLRPLSLLLWYYSPVKEIDLYVMRSSYQINAGETSDATQPQSPAMPEAHLPSVFLSISGEDLGFAEQVQENVIEGLCEIYTRSFLNAEELLSAMEKRVRLATLFVLLVSKAS